MIEQLRKTHKNVVLVDAGDMFFKTKSFPEIRARYILNGMDRMGYDAVTFGEGDLNMDFGFLKEQVKTLKVPFDSSNIQVFNDENTPVFLPYVIKEFDGIKIAITGVTPWVMMDDHVQENKNIKIENEYFNVKNFEEKADDHLERVHDFLMMQENIKTGLIYGPHFKYYPISLDRFINEIVDREFRV